VAGELRQSVGAAKHLAAALATRQHGPRPEQLGTCFFVADDFCRRLARRYRSRKNSAAIIAPRCW
jgi:hypothetical protein